MKSFAFETWDAGRLVVNEAFAPMLRQAGLTTFDALFAFAGGDVAKNLLRERTTTRIVLPNGGGQEQAFYLKRHGPPPLKEYVKPWLRFTRPLLGARHEWNAILEFHKAGLSTMTPVATGSRGGRSLLLTAAIENSHKLSAWMAGPSASSDEETRREVIRRVAETTRLMHRAGLHHQDYYLGHLMVPADDVTGEVQVIDLGRARRRRPLARRWIVKDLGQLNYSAPMLSDDERREFLQVYLDRPPSPNDAGLIRSITAKTQRIARHSRKNRL